MARGKYDAKKQGTTGPSAGLSRGVGSPSVVGSSQRPATPALESAGGQAETPALGIVVMSSWGWRIMAVAVMVAIGLAITFLLDGHAIIGALWILIAGGWGYFTFKLWRMHLAWDLGR